MHDIMSSLLITWMYQLQYDALYHSINETLIYLERRSEEALVSSS
jgi:hypothetical protein